MQKRRGLGRGLEFLLSATSPTETVELTEEKERPALSTPLTEQQLQTIALENIVPSPYQPRREMDEDALAELAESIRQQGVIQPIVVRKLESHFELIAGERRWRAAKLAKLNAIPALIYHVDDQKAMLCALIENMQRENLSALEEAEALQKIAEHTHFTHEQLATSVGKSRVMVTNLLRLLQLDPRVKLLLQQKDLEMGHARALLALNGEQQWLVANHIVNKKLSVRAAESFIQLLQLPKKPRAVKDPILMSRQQQLSRQFATRVTVQNSKNGEGKIVFAFKDEADLHRILDKFV